MRALHRFVVCFWVVSAVAVFSLFCFFYLTSQEIRLPKQNSHERDIWQESSFEATSKGENQSWIGTVDNRSLAKAEFITRRSEATLVPSGANQQQTGDPRTLRINITSNPMDNKESARPTGLKTEIKETMGIGACIEKSSSLVGRLFVNKTAPKMADLEKDLSHAFHGWVDIGGTWKPTECKARKKIVLIIPYRKRYEHLSIFLRHMHPLLKRQNLDYRIVVVEQTGETPFNRAMLFNIGYKEALKFDQYECFIFHDVDLIPEDDRNAYSCPTSPRHMSVAPDTHNYQLLYTTLFGGAGSFTREHFEDINGFSNVFWGWGGEDDDLYKRITRKGYKLTRPSMEIGRYTMLTHLKSEDKDPERFDKLRTSEQRMADDGINSLKYNLLKVEEFPLYTLVQVYIDKHMSGKR